MKRKQKIVNHIIFVLDASGSMGHLRQDVIQQFNQQISDLRVEKDQENRVSLIKFSSNYSIHTVFKDLDIGNVALYESQYKTGGQTALYDAVDAGVKLGEEIRLEPGANHAFLVITITDGGENDSVKFSGMATNPYCGVVETNPITTLLQQKTLLGNWSFVFLVPNGQANSVASQFGVTPANVKGWEISRAGLYAGTQSVSMGLRGYTKSRAGGQSMTQSFYTPNVALAENHKFSLSRADQGFLRVPIVKTQMIREAVEHLGGTAYKAGTCLYELTKKETIQADKQLALLHIATNSIYVNGLKTVAETLGLPRGKAFRVVPANHPDFRIFVQSKSVNRKLLPGTTLLVEKAAL